MDKNGQLSINNDGTLEILGDPQLSVANDKQGLTQRVEILATIVIVIILCYSIYRLGKYLLNKGFPATMMYLGKLCGIFINAKNKELKK